MATSPKDHSKIKVSFIDTSAPADMSKWTDGEKAFYQKNGYLWDWIMAFALKNPRAVPGHVLEIIRNLSHAGLTVETEFDHEGTILFLKIGADVERLAHHADAIDYKMLADPLVLENIAANGVPAQPGLERAIAKFEIGHDPTITHYTPYEYVYLPYEKEEPKCNWFLRPQGKTHPFVSLHRVKLIKSIITSDTVDGDTVCGINVRGLIADNVVDAFYPVHDKERVNEILKTWIFSWTAFPWNLSTARIRGYFGEKITLYFAFVAHYATWLIGPALIGLIPFGFLAHHNFEAEAYNNPLLGIYAIFIAIWAIFMLEFWKRKQKRYNLEWGMDGFEEQEAERPEFEGTFKAALTHDKNEKHYPVTYYRLKLGFSVGIVSFMVCVVVAAVAAIFVFRWVLERTSASAYAATLASILNSVQITILNEIYSVIALSLNKWENHRTDTQYQDALIAKLFAFQFVNSYASMAYIAFVQPYDEDHPCPNNNNCIGSLANNLTTIFISRLITGNMSGVIVPFFKYKYQRRSEEKAEGHAYTDLEKQFKMNHYDPIMDLLFDYATIAITYGFAVLFVMANPIVPLLAMVSSYIEIRGDGFKLLKIHRRPEPGGVEDIGTWQTVFTFITFVSIVSNSALIAFTTDTFDGPYVNPFWLFYILQILGFFIVAVTSEIIPDVPVPVEIQLERNQFWTRKLIDQVQEEVEDPSADRRYKAIEPESLLPGGWSSAPASPRYQAKSPLNAGEVAHPV